jgi:branched-chain amino acid transport system permease protein/neutral amino acid transport system permease protein
MSLLASAIGFGLVTAAVLTLATLGFNLQFAVSDVLNVAFASLMTVGQFMAYVLNRQGWSIWISAAAAMVVVGALSLLLNRYVLEPFQRRGTPPFGIVLVTFAISLMITYILQGVFGPGFFAYQLPDNSGAPVHLGGMILTRFQLTNFVIAATCVVGLNLLLFQTPVGRAIRAVADDRPLAQGAGINVRLVTDATWFVSGGVAAIAGVLLAVSQSNFGAVSSDVYLILVLAAAFVGGAGKPYGAVIGALVIGLTMEVSAVWIEPQYKTIVAFAVLIVVLLVKPSGVLGLARGQVRA